MIRSIPQGIIPYTLEKWGIPKDQLQLLADESFTKGRMDNNVVDLTIDDVMEVLKSIFY